MKLYIAGPISGVADFVERFTAAADSLRLAGYEVESPVHEDDLLPDGSEAHDWHWYMRRDMHQLLDCDGVALLAGWTSSRGAVIEQRVANDLGIPTRAIEEWLDERAAA